MSREDAGRRWRVIGVGSPVAGDDLGWRAIDALRDAGFDRHAELLSLDRPGPALLDHFESADQVILIDAMEAGLPPGSLRDLTLDDLLSVARPPSSHDLGLAESLALARALGSLPRVLRVLGIQRGDGSQRAGAGLDRALQRVVSRVQSVIVRGDAGSF